MNSVIRWLIILYQATDSTNINVIEIDKKYILEAILWGFLQVM